MQSKFELWCEEVNAFADAKGIESFNARELRPFYYDGYSVADTVEMLQQIRESE